MIKRSLCVSWCFCASLCNRGKALFCLILTLLLSSPLLTAPIQNHFRHIGNKEGYHAIHNVDFIYLLNLDERPEKWQDCQRRLLPHRVMPCRVSAINGWKLSSRAINELGIKYNPDLPHGLAAVYYDEAGKSHQEVAHIHNRNYFACNMSRGAIGCALTHLSVLQDAYNSGYQTIWVMEDDVEVLQNPHLISQLIEKLDKKVGKGNWDVLYTDRDSKSREGHLLPCYNYGVRPNYIPSHPGKFRLRKKISRDFCRVGARFGTYSMIIRRSGMAKILQFFKRHKLFLPYDMDLVLAPNIRLYTTLEDIVSTQPTAVSDNWVAGYK